VCHSSLRSYEFGDFVHVAPKDLRKEDDCWEDDHEECIDESDVVQVDDF